MPTATEVQKNVVANLTSVLDGIKMCVYHFVLIFDKIARRSTCTRTQRPITFYPACVVPASGDCKQESGIQPMLHTFGDADGWWF